MYNTHLKNYMPNSTYSAFLFNISTIDRKLCKIYRGGKGYRSYSSSCRGKRILSSLFHFCFGSGIIYQLKIPLEGKSQ